MVRAPLPLLALLLLALTPTAALAGDGSSGTADHDGLADDDDDDGDDEGPAEDEGDSPDGDDGDDDGVPPWLDDGGDDDDDTSATPPPPAASAAMELDIDPVDLGTLKGGGLFGIGVAAGSINGLSLKIWPKQTHGIVLHLGAHPAVLNSLALSLQYRIHTPAIVVPRSPVAIHFSLGPAFRTRIVWFTNGTFIEMSGGAAFGASVTFAKAPVEIFAEAIPTFGGGVSPGGVGVGFGVDGVGGLRIFVGK